MVRLYCWFCALGGFVRMLARGRSLSDAVFVFKFDYYLCRSRRGPHERKRKYK